MTLTDYAGIGIAIFGGAVAAIMVLFRPGGPYDRGGKAA